MQIRGVASNVCCGLSVECTGAVVCENVFHALEAVDLSILKIKSVTPLLEHVVFRLTYNTEEGSIS